MYYSSRAFEEKWEEPSKKNCIRIVHFFSGRLPGIRTQITKDSNSVSVFLLFSQQFCNYRQMRKSGIIYHQYLILTHYLT
jgi:hypothetical protein